jgi:hypothetical protein
VQHGADIPVTFNNGDTLGARAKADGTVEVYKNGDLLGTRDVSSWPYYSMGGYIGLWFIEATGAVLDDFGGGTITGGEGFMGESSPVFEPGSAIDPFDITLTDSAPFWQGLEVGASQASRVTFSSLQAGVGKPHSNGVWGDGAVSVLYDASNQRIQLWTHSVETGWTQQGTDIPVTFADGDVFSARALANGTVEIYRNGKLLAKRDVIP